MTTTSSPMEDTSARYTEAGFTGAFELGSRPALLIVDLSYGFTDPACPLGFDMSETLERTRRILDVARRRDVACFFTTIAFEPATRASTTWLRKVPSLAALSPDSRWVELDSRLGRKDHEPLVTKGGASAFHGTSMHALLVAHQVDTVLVAGATTSGCVRATVVDAVQNGFNTFVVTDCVGDRSARQHEANLVDMAAKYADPLTAEEVMRYLENLPESARP